MRPMRTLKNLFFLICLLVVSRVEAFAQNPYSRSFPLAVTGINIGELVVSFEDVIEVGTFSVSLSVSSTSPTSSIFPALVLPYQLPLLNSPLFITINTTTSFRGPALITLRIYPLEYVPNVPLRFFAAAGTIGSSYRDITSAAGSGSMYTSGYRPGFSEFVLALDLRLLGSVIDTKLEELGRAVDTQRNAMLPSRVLEVGASLQTARLEWQQGNKVNAIAELERLIESVRQGATSGEIPFSYNDPTNPFGNVGGDLIARTKTTLFSLKLAQ